MFYKEIWVLTIQYGSLVSFLSTVHDATIVVVSSTTTDDDYQIESTIVEMTLVDAEGWRQCPSA
jgi:hypothetical protein